MATGFARLGLASFGLVITLAAMSRPSAAQDANKPAAVSNLDRGHELFANYGCGGCHILAAAGAMGDVGPAFDGDSDLTEAFVADRVANGQGAMPAFGGQLSAEEIAVIAAYVVQAAHK